MTNHVTDNETTYIVNEATEALMTMLRDIPDDRRLEVCSKLLTFKKEKMDPKTILEYMIDDVLKDVPNESMTASFHGVAAVQEVIPQQKAQSNEMLTRQEVSEMIGRTLNTVTNQVNKNKMVGYFSGSSLHIPAWQFKNDEVIPGIRDVLKAMDVNGLDAIANITTPLERLGGRNILTLLSEGNIAEAVRAAERLKES
ncbi:MAG: hypothetical protein SWN10_13750 [Pseudomonadota bacterium]|jgi:hypothetical protein|nr:hypothetical protein [Pseudomonadota bacterium]